MKAFTSLVFACLLSLVFFTPASATTPGTLDPTFSRDGVARSSLLSNSAPDSVQVDAQNRVIVGGIDAKLDAPLVLRYRANGALDPTWGKRFLPGTGGVVGIGLIGAKTLVATSAGWVVRLQPNGALDTTFGSGGRVLMPMHLVALGTNASGYAYALGEMGSGHSALFRIRPDGKAFTTHTVCIGAMSYAPSCGRAISMTVSPTYVYVGGEAPVVISSSAVIGRFNPDGTLDTAYGLGGYGWLHVQTSTDPGNAEGSDATAVAVSPKTGQVTAVGEFCNGGCYHAVSFVARFTAAGLIDPAFKGHVYFGDDQGSGGTDSFPYGVTLQSGKVVIVGEDYYCNERAASCFGIERLTSSGAFDPTFAGVGYLHTSKAPANASDVRVFNTKIVVAGGQYVARLQG